MSRSNHKNLPQQRRGAAIVLMIFMLIAAFVLSFFIIDLASLQREHAENQVISDLASRFGSNMTTITADEARIEKAVAAIVNENQCQKNNRSTNQTFTTEIGSVNPDNLAFVPGGKPINSVRVNVSSSLNTIGFMNRQSKSLDVARDATAASFHQDICLVLDKSSSMCYLDSKHGVYPTFEKGNKMLTSDDPRARDNAHKWWQHWAHPGVTRWARLIDAIKAMASEMKTTEQDEFLSIVTYSHKLSPRFWDQSGKLVQFHFQSAEIESQPTFDYEKAVGTLEKRYRDERLVYGYTNIEAGIKAGTKILTGPNSRDNAYKTMVVMTDGRYNQGAHPAIAAKAAAEQGIHIVAITFGVGAAKNTMRDVAKAADGIHFHATSGVELIKVFRQVANIPPYAFIE